MSEDEDKTNATKVYQSGSADNLKTVTYGSDDALKTASYGSQTESRTDRTATHNLGVGDTVQLAGSEYRIERIISGEKKSGEAVIYLIRDASDKDYALKLYYPFRDPRDEPNAEALKRIKEIDNPDILKLHHFGTGAEKYQGQFCYEISDFARGGDLLKCENIKEKYTPAFLEQHVVPEIFKGIQVLHQHRIYHCDLKPQNVFYRDEQQTDLVIGDYGSAKTFEQSSEKELSYMSVVKGTDFYLAPEQAIGIISEKNDYYSFGMILLHLLYPEKADQQTLRKIYERRAAEKPIIDYDPKYKRLNDLIAGLTLQDIQQRWGQKEVSQWLTGKSVAVNYKKAAAPSVMPIKLKATTIQTEEDLLEYVQKGDEWYRLLIEDDQGHNLLLTWISQIRDIESKQSFDKLMRIAGKYGKRYAREAVIRYFQPDRPVKLISEYNLFNTDNIEKLATDFLQELDDQWKIILVKDDRMALFSFIMALEQYADVAEGNKKLSAKALIGRFLKCLGSKTTNASSQKELKKALKKSVAANEPLPVVTGQWDLLSKEISDDGMVRIFYDFNPARGFRDLTGKSFSTLEDVAFCFAGNPGLWNERFLSAERCVFLERNSHVMLTAKERGDFLMDVFRDHIRWMIHIDKLTPMTESDRVTIKYKVSGSLEDFFQERGVREELHAKAKTGSVVISDLSKKETDTVCTEALKFIETEHNLPEKKWSQSSLESLHKDISLFRENFIRDIQKFQQQKLIADIMHTIRAFAILLPVIPLYLMYLAYFEKNVQLINFLSGLLPFTADFSGIALSEDTVFPMAGNLVIVTLASVLPSWLLCRGVGGWIAGFIVTQITLIAIWFLTPLIMAALSLFVNIAVLSLIRPTRIKVQPLLISLTPLFIIIFLTDILFRADQPSARILRPLNAGVIIRNSYLTQEKPAFIRTGISEEDPIIGTIIDKDSITVIDEKQGWYLVRNQDAEGFAPAEKIGLLGFMKTPGLLPSSDVAYPMNMIVTAKSNETFIRAGRSDAYAIIGLLPQNKEATAIKEDSNWYLVRYQNTEGYLKTSDVNETVIKKGRLINKNPVLRKEPNYTSKSLGNRWYGTINIYAEHDGWYLIRSYYGRFGYIPQKDMRILK